MNMYDKFNEMIIIKLLHIIQVTDNCFFFTNFKLLVVSFKKISIFFFFIKNGTHLKDEGAEEVDS